MTTQFRLVVTKPDGHRINNSSWIESNFNFWTLIRVNYQIRIFLVMGSARIPNVYFSTKISGEIHCAPYRYVDLIPISELTDSDSKKIGK